jgi:serine protease Do
VADNLGFAIPVAYVKEFINHREAFAFDKANPNTGYRYVDPPRRINPNQPEGLKYRGSGTKTPSKPAGEPPRRSG